MTTPLISIIQKIRTWRKFSPHQRELFLQALILLPLIDLSLNVWGFKRTYSILRNIGNGEWGMGNREWGMENGEWGIEKSAVLGYHATCYKRTPVATTRRTIAENWLGNRAGAVAPQVEQLFKTEKHENSISSQILTTASMVKIAAKYYKWATCLRKSLALWFLLRRQRITTELQIGTRFYEGEFQAHAWVEYQEYVVGVERHSVADQHQMVKQHFASFENLNSNLNSQRPKYQPEIEILLCCNNIHTDTAKPKRIESLLQKDIDWNYLQQQAFGHGVFLLLYQNLVKYYPESIPKKIQPQLQEYCQIKSAHNLFLSKKLCQLIKIFDNNNIKVIPFKGCVLAASAYQNLTLREFCDIDLIIKQEDFSTVQEILISLGYQHRSELQPWGQDFTNKDDGIHIDIHWQLAPSYFPYRVDFQQLWQRRETVSILNQQVTLLSTEDSLLILCLQIVKDAHHRQEKLKQIYDIAQLIKNPKLDWKVVIQQAQNLGSERLLLFGLGIANQLLQVEIPSQLKQNIAGDWIVNLYLARVVKQFFSKENKQDILRALILLERSKFFGKHNRYLFGYSINYTINQIIKI